MVDKLENWESGVTEPTHVESWFDNMFSLLSVNWFELLYPDPEWMKVTKGNVHACHRLSLLFLASSWRVEVEDMKGNDYHQYMKTKLKYCTFSSDSMPGHSIAE